jgi:CRISPR-associated endoribonuclease Cas6
MLELVQSTLIPLRAPELPLARFRLMFRCHNQVAPDAFLGSAWRGVLGRELLAKACRSAGCTGGQHAPNCRYVYLFETPHALGKFTDSGNVPHPLVISVPWRAQSQSAILTLQLTLFGCAVCDAGLVLDALRVGARKLRPTGPLDLVSIEEEVEPGSGIWRTLQQKRSPEFGSIHIPLPPSGLRVTLLTPLRLRIQNQEITPPQFRIAHLFSNLLRRISLLTCHHTRTPLETDFAGLTRMAEHVALLRKDLIWYDMARYSSRQQDLIPIGGLLGNFEFSLSGSEALWPYFWLGQFTHAGKGTAMGLGRYRVWTG